MNEYIRDCKYIINGIMEVAVVYAHNILDNARIYSETM